MTGKNAWIRDVRRGPRPAAHLIFFPHAGGSASYYRPFAAHLGEHFDVSAIQYPGRQDRWNDPFVTSVEGLADEIVGCLSPHDTTPLVLFGHSMGASVAFETARRLADLGRPAPRRLVVSGRRAPSMFREEKYFHLGTDAELLAEVGRLDGTHSQLLDDPDMVNLILPAIRNDYRVIETYRPAADAVLDIPLLCLTGAADPRVTREEAAAWKAHTVAEYREETFDGGHFYLADHPAAVCRAVESFVSGE
ncbi:thioesterase [Streptomyces chrestomyceticus JCM 4735]|uniref:Thioesterase n=1 Tax=Streptomyces chrestomyceticus JCM 4735 TaxID=1306181 RepID=A0A7U9KQG3_9ACTN|nr:alpha/beta fold hydrolase [Streptomyces chrestomyceticus]GCD33569.1 thioesterase [Streptomyces chrestomyceticus JCM 4735]